MVSVVGFWPRVQQVARPYMQTRANTQMGGSQSEAKTNCLDDCKPAYDEYVCAQPEDGRDLTRSRKDAKTNTSSQKDDC